MVCGGHRPSFSVLFLCPCFRVFCAIVDFCAAELPNGEFPPQCGDFLRRSVLQTVARTPSRHRVPRVHLGTGAASRRFPVLPPEAVSQLCPAEPLSPGPPCRPRWPRPPQALGRRGAGAGRPPAGALAAGRYRGPGGEGAPPPAEGGRGRGRGNRLRRKSAVREEGRNSASTVQTRGVPICPMMPAFAQKSELRGKTTSAVSPNSGIFYGNACNSPHFSSNVPVFLFAMAPGGLPSNEEA